MTKNGTKWAYLMVATALMSGCANTPFSDGDKRARAISQRDAQLRSLEAQRQMAQRSCDRGVADQCQRVEILNHEMDAFLVRPW